MVDRVRHRVVVTGMGVVSPIGNSVTAFVESLLAGESGGGPITLFDPASLPTRLIASGRRRWMLAAGTDSMINPLGLAGFCRIGATTTANEAPRRASRPFDAARDGFVLGEGAGILLLEALDDARARGAPIHAEI